MANPDGQRERSLAGEHEPCAAFLRILRLLPQLQTCVRPVQLRSHEQVHEQGRLAVVEVDALAVFRVILDAGADTAPEAVFGSRVLLAAFLVVTQRHEVAHHSRRRVLRGQNVVVQRALIVVGILRTRVPAEEMSRQLEHVVGIAGFARVGAECLRQGLLRREVLTQTMAANHV